MLRPVEVSAVHYASAHLGRMAVHVLGGGMGDYVAAELERTAEDGGGERVVHDERHAVPVRDLRKLGDVEHHAGRVGDSLAEHALRVGAERLRDLGRGGVGIDERELDAELLQRDGEEVEGAAVYLGRRYDVVSGVAQVECSMLFSNIK